MAVDPSGMALDVTGEPSRLETRDGLEIAGFHHRLATPKARVVLVHGFGEHGRRYGHVVAQLLARGYECHLLDLRGHGASQGQRGHVPELQAYHDDLHRFTQSALSVGTLAPAVLFGHSLGGLISLSALLEGGLPFSGLMVSSPFLAPAFDVPAIAAVAMRLASKVLPRWSFSAGIEASGLSRDPDVVSDYLEDPEIVRTVTLGWGTAVLAAQREVLERAGEITIPALFLLGDADPIAAFERSRTVFRLLGSPDKTLRVYEGYRHEVLNEIGRERVMRDLLAWLDERFAIRRPAPS